MFLCLLWTSKYLMWSFNKHLSEAYSEPYQTSKMKLFAKMVKSFQPLTILTKSSILEVWQGPECIF